MPIQKLINSALAYLDIRFTRLGDKIVGAISKIKGEDIGANIDKQSRVLATFVSRIEKAINTMKEPKFTGEIKVDVTKLGNELSKSISSIKASIKPTNLNDVKSFLKTINTSIKLSNDSNKNHSIMLLRELKSLSEVMKEIKLVVPSTFKLDEMQLRALKPQGGGFGGALPARTSIITRVSMSSSNTEYSHIFNKGAVSWRIKLEAQDASFNYSWTTGKLKVSGDASEYISIPANWLESRDNVEYRARTIYFESGSSSQKMEIEENIA